MDIITRVRTYKNADYLFVLNDKRDYGDYLGPWKLTMEKGLPNSGIVTLDRKAAAVYDLVAHKPVNFKVVNGKTIIPQVFDTNDGRLLMVMDETIGKVKCSVKQTGRACSRVVLSASVLGGKGKPVKALVPIEISVYAPDGNRLDGSGAACAVDGSIQFEFTTTPMAGTWKVVVTELASGKKGEATFKQK